MSLTRERMSVPKPRMSIPRRRMNAPPSRMSLPQVRMNVPERRMNVPGWRTNVPPLRMNAPRTRMSVPRRRMKAPRPEMSIHPGRRNTPRPMKSAPRRRMSAPRRRTNAPPPRKLLHARLFEHHPHPVRVVGLEDQGAVAVLAQATGDVLFAELDLLEGLLGGRNLEDEARLVLRAKGLKSLVVGAARIFARRRAEDLKNGGAGLKDGAAGVLPLPTVEPRQGEGLAIEFQRTIKVHRAAPHAKLPDLHFIPLLGSSLDPSISHPPRRRSKGVPRPESR